MLLHIKIRYWVRKENVMTKICCWHTLSLAHICSDNYIQYKVIKGMEHVPNIFMSFDKNLFLEVINILILIGLFKQYEIQLFKIYLNPI